MSKTFVRFRNPLLAIILAYLVVGALYAALTPPWQAPDEPAHYNYVRYLAENRRLPVLRMGDYPHDYLEEIKAAKFPATMSIEPIRYEFYQPPLYYILAAVVYVLFGGRLFPLRLLSVLLGAALLRVAYCIVKEVFPQREGLALGTAAFVAFVPMHVAMTAAVNNDALAELILAGILWMLVRYIKEGGRERRLVGLGVLMGLGLLTKATTLIALPLAPFAVVASDLVHRPSERLDAGTLRRCLLPLGCCLLLALPWFARNALVYGDLDILGQKRHDAIVVGQPRTSEWLARYGAAEVARRFLLTTFRSFWAQFGWMGVPVDGRIYLALALLCLAVGLGLALFAVRIFRQPHLLTPFQKSALALLALSFLLSLLSYLWYNAKFVQHQGRYLFPALVPIGLAFSLGLREVLARKGARAMAVLFLAAALILVVKGLATRDFNRLSIVALGGGALAFAAKALLPQRYDDIAFALPYLGLFALDLICLFGFIIPSLAP